MGRTRIRLHSVAIAAALVVPGAPRFAAGQADFDEARTQVLIVRGFDSMGRAVGDISGFAVGAGFVVTNGQMLRAAESVLVVMPEDAAEFQATVTVSDRRSDLAILHAEGLDAAGALFAADGAEPETGDGFYLPRFAEDGSLDDEPARGSVSELRILEPTAVGDRAVLLYRHNAQATARQYGMPMLNDCGEVIGMLRTAPGMSQTVLNTRPDPGDSPFGVSAAEVRRLLAVAEAEPRIAGDPCLDPLEAVEQAQGEAEDARLAEEEARREAEAAEQRLREMEADSETTQEELGAAREEAEAARAEADSKRSDLDAAEANLDAAQQTVDALEAENRWLLVVLILGAAAAVAIVLILGHRLRRRRADLAASKEALESAIQPAAFSCLLEGADDTGRAYAVKISAEQLGSPSGVVVGRNPAQAGALLDHPEASREHFRLAVSGRGSGRRGSPFHQRDIRGRGTPATGEGDPGAGRRRDRGGIRDQPDTEGQPCVVMRPTRRESNIFNVSAIDLFASALGAFMIVSFVLLPYFPNTGEVPPAPTAPPVPSCSHARTGAVPGDFGRGSRKLLKSGSRNSGAGSTRRGAASAIRFLLSMKRVRHSMRRGTGSAASLQLSTRPLPQSESCRRSTW